jgi:hypothetical protein
MKDKKFIEIKNRIYKQCLQLWGIDDLDMADPLILLILDVIIYEIYYLNQDLIDSDAKIIESVAQQVIPNSWSLPMPAHALMSTMSNNKITKLSSKTEFSIKNTTSQSINSAIYFTPFTSEKIIEGYVCIQYYNNFILCNGNVEYIDKKVSDFKVWIGIKTADDVLDNLDFLKITFLTENSSFDELLKFVEVKDYLGNKVEFDRERYNEVEDNKHYTEQIKSYYSNYIYRLTLNEENTVLRTAIEQFSIEKETTKCKEVNQKLVWFEFTFPEVFSKEELDKINIVINTFPVVNRKLNEKRHEPKNQGRLFSVKSSNNSHFLDIISIKDNEGNKYYDSVKFTIDTLNSNTYTLFNGGLENYDPRNAKFFLKKFARVLREDVSAFSSIKGEYIDTTMDRINAEINAIEDKIKVSFDDINNKEDVFVLINKTGFVEHLFCTYWTSDGKDANNFKKGTILKQTKVSELMPETTMLQTTSAGGVYRADRIENIINFRYGFLTRERIVTTQDIKAAIQFYLRNIIHEIIVKDGVGISINKKKGLYRTIEVMIKLKKDTTLDSNTKRKVELFLKDNLEQNSVMNIPFQININ